MQREIHLSELSRETPETCHEPSGALELVVVRRQREERMKDQYHIDLEKYGLQKFKENLNNEIYRNHESH